MKRSALFSSRTFLLIGFSLLLAAVAGLRLLGLDRDFRQYEAFYNLSDYQMGLSRFEPGFRWVASLGHSFGVDFWGFALFVACASVPLKTYVIAKVSQRSAVPWLYYIPYFFVLLDMTAVRLGLASSIMLLGVYLVSIRKRLFGGLFIGLSVLFHYQMIVPIIAFTAIMSADQLTSRYRKALSAVVIGVGVAGVYGFARYFDFGEIGRAGEWAARYVDSSDFSGAAWYQPSVIQSIMLLWLGRSALQSPQRLVRTAWFVGAFGVAVYYILSGVGAAVFRLADGLFFFNLLWLGYAAKHARPMDRLLMKVSLIVFGVFYTTLFYLAEVPYLRFAERWSIS